MSPARLGILAVVLIAVIGGGYFAADRVLLSPSAEKQGTIAELTDRIERLDAALNRGRAARERWRGIRATTIASTDQDAAHRVRDLVSQIGSRTGLTEVVVNHGRPTIPSNPAAERRSRLSRRLRSALEDREDFRVLRGTLRGTGTLDQLATAAVTLSSQPWAHRIESLRVEPANRDRTQFDLSIAFATLYTVEGPAVAAPELVPADPARLESVLAVARVNPFVPPPAPPPEPEPEPVRVATPDPTPAPPPPPPFDRWRITGVVERTGPSTGTGTGTVTGPGAATAPPVFEVFMMRTDTNEKRVLRPGDTILGLTLRAADTRGATLHDGTGTVSVRVGQTLDQRTNAE